MKNIFLILFLLVSAAAFAAPADNILPKPNKIQVGEGTFVFPSQVTIGYADDSLQPAAQYLATVLRNVTGQNATVMQGKGTFTLALNTTLPAEGYQLHVGKGDVTLQGQSYEGVVNGIQTLRQLCPELPVADVEDAPRYGWRGLMLDVSRHYYNKEEVMEFLEIMAQYKLNKLHWHLTDDQGWRIEIKQYPDLTAKGAWRKLNNQDRICLNRAKAEDNSDLIPDMNKCHVENGDTIYGGFYTQDDIREVVAFARIRGIDIVPEIDMPGHMLAGVSNYPGVSCFEETGWGQSFSSPVCPGKDSALEFCRNILSEVIDLFPYEYVHIGGDEVEKTNWKKCPDCQKRMKDLGLKNEEELQAWFIRQMEQFINSRGKKMIGWDEIIEGGLSSTATVSWWRSWSSDSPVIATAQGNEVIFCPNAQFYLDYAQDANSVPNIYNYDPNLPELNDRQRSLIKGIQGNIWCEQIPSRNQLYFMAAPRMLAIAELAWSRPEQKDFSDFQRRMVGQFPSLRAQDINYRIPDIQGFYKTNAFIGTSNVAVTCIDPSAQIFYTTDGSVPTLQSQRLTGNLQLTETTDVTFRVFRSNGKPGEISRARFIRDSYAPAVSANPQHQGLQTVWHEFPGIDCNKIQETPVNGTYTTAGVEIPAEAKGNIGLIITGFFLAPADDIYTFDLTSDDGSFLKVDDDMVVDMNKEQSPVETVGQKALAKGYHKFEVRYFDHNGGLLTLEVRNSRNQVLQPAQIFRY